MPFHESPGSQCSDARSEPDRDAVFSESLWSIFSLCRAQFPWFYLPEGATLAESHIKEVSNGRVFS
jgi:hypothetical protein